MSSRNRPGPAGVPYPHARLPTQEETALNQPRLSDASCLVTGAAGFIGSHLCERLVAEGARVASLSKQVSQVRPPRLAHLDDRLTVVEGNLLDAGALRLLVDRLRPRYVFHLGAYTHVGKSFDHVDESLQTNIAGTVNLLQALRGSDYETFVYTGTSEIYGASPVPFTETMAVSPLSPYAVSKYAGERYCRMFFDAYGWPVVMLRPFNAYGPRQSPDRIVPEVIVSALSGIDIAMTEGTQTREFNFAADLVDGIVRAAVAGQAVHGEVINLGCGEDHSMRDMAVRIIEQCGSSIEPRFGALPQRPTEIPRMFCDSRKARDLLGWTPATALNDGLKTTIDFYRSEMTRPDSPYLLRRPAPGPAM
jgi:UDP-glucose 4-epimerase